MRVAEQILKENSSLVGSLKLTSLLDNYKRAILQASSGRIARFPIAAYSVARSRSIHGIGPRFHSLYDLINQPEELWNEYVIDEELRPYLRRFNPKEHRNIVSDKILFFKHCSEHNIRSIPVLATLDTEGCDELNALAKEKWLSMLIDAPSSIFVKLIDGTGGIDAFSAERNKNGTWHYCNQQGRLEDLHDFCLRRLDGRRGWIIQPTEKNAAELLRIMSPNALGTVRIVSTLVNGQPKILFAVLRLPVGDNTVDNFAHGTAGNLTAPINLENGELGVACGSTSKTWPSMINVRRHPNTGELIPGTIVPFWAELVDLVKAGQRSFPNLRTLGWDVAIAERGPVVVEANATYDMDLIQVAHKRGWKSELLSALSEARPEIPAQLGRERFT